MRNYHRTDKTCQSKAELFAHLCRDVESAVSASTLIAAARIMPDAMQAIHPTYFLTEDSARLISQYSRFKRYGMGALYSGCDIPNAVMQAFDVIQTALDKREYDKMKAITKKAH